MTTSELFEFAIDKLMEYFFDFLSKLPDSQISNDSSAFEKFREVLSLCVTIHLQLTCTGKSYTKTSISYDCFELVLTK